MSDKITYICPICGATRIVAKASYKGKQHNQFCTKYYYDKLKSECGVKVAEKFHRTYRIARERCNNPKNKDYLYYKGKFKFKNFIEYIHQVWDEFYIAVQTYGIDDLSIDRLDNSKGYESGNIRYVPMKQNLQNRDVVKPILAVNQEHGLIITSPSISDLTNRHQDFVSTSAMHSAVKNNKLYKKWKLSYMI